jgi:hypothetical protein
VELRRTRVLVVTDMAQPTDALIEGVVTRAERGDVQFRLVVLNPARAELHLLHPERHDLAFDAERVLLETAPELERAADAPVIGSVSIRHDPMDAIEETILDEPVDEILLSLPDHALAKWLHQDLQHRLRRWRLPVTVLPPPTSP